MEKLYVLKGGLKKRENIIEEETFYLLTYDLKGNVGYIGRRSKILWRLYTIIGGGTIKNSNADDWRYHHFETFKECIEKLKLISKVPVEVIDNVLNESTVPINTNVQIASSYNNIPKLDESVLEQIAKMGFQITPGAVYKLELYLESLKDKPVVFARNVENATVYNSIFTCHQGRLEELKARLKNEESIIRPDDIPDFET
ncbi:MAG: hypothetical protein ABI402_14260 [Ferruginibacter sp.]